MESRRPDGPSAPTNNIVRQARGGSGSGLLTTALIVLLIITSIVTSAYLITPHDHGRSLRQRGQNQAISSPLPHQWTGLLRPPGRRQQRLCQAHRHLLLAGPAAGPARPNNNNNQQPNVSLAKLGNELHGPEDSMYVSHEQVLFWEKPQGQRQSRSGHSELPKGQVI